MDEFRHRAQPLLILLGVIWAVEGLNLLLGHRLTDWGILPRSAAGLIGIPLAPFIHASLWHAISNSVALVVLGGLVLTGGTRRFWRMTLAIVLLAGLLVWLFARASHHVGASGLVFGYFGALLAGAVIERSTASILIAFATIALFGGVLWGVLPLHSHITVEGHLFGGLAGVAVAWAAHQIRKRRAPSPAGFRRRRSK